VCTREKMLHHFHHGMGCWEQACEHRLYCCLCISHFGGRVFDLFPDDVEIVLSFSREHMKMNPCVQAPTGDSRRPHLEPACWKPVEDTLFHTACELLSKHSCVLSLTM